MEGLGSKMKMASYRWSAELQNSGQQNCCCSMYRNRRLIMCAVISGIISATLAIAFVVAWCLYDAEGDALVGIKVD